MMKYDAPQSEQHPLQLVLIAEDEPLLAEIIATTLQDEGLEIITVNDGARALALARGLHPQLLITDIMMPGMTGMEVCTALKSDPVTAEIPIILLTARSEPEDRRNGLAAGALEYLIKPFNPLELISLVNKALAGKTVMPRSYDEVAAALSTDQLLIYARELRTLFERERVERRALEKTQQRLAELDQLKATFLGTITHELLTPFSNFGLALQVAQKEAETYPSLTASLDELGRMMSILHRRVKGVVKFAELVNKRRAPQLGDYQLAKVLPWALHPLMPLAQSREVDFRVIVKPDLPTISIDPELVGEAVFQMAHNAIKFTPAAGTARVYTVTTEAGVWIEVKDTGWGLAPEQLTFLGQPFENSADALRTGQEGMGIGWALTCYVAQVHNGKTRVESAGLGQGSTFALFLPWSQ